MNNSNADRPGLKTSVKVSVKEPIVKLTIDIDDLVPISVYFFLFTCLYGNKQFVSI